MISHLSLLGEYIYIYVFDDFDVSMSSELCLFNICHSSVPVESGRKGRPQRIRCPVRSHRNEVIFGVNRLQGASMKTNFAKISIEHDVVRYLFQIFINMI